MPKLSHKYQSRACMIKGGVSMKLSSRSLKLAVLAILCFYIFIGFSCAFASDVDDGTFNKELNVDDINVPIDESNEPVQEDEDVLGDFDELNNDIQNLSPGDVYDFTKDYSFKGGIDSTKQFITINKEIIINGNGHTIDGQHLSGLFKITANNVKIYNLTFINFEFHGVTIKSPTIDARGPKIGGYSTKKTLDDKIFYIYTENYSPIQWKGDNGLISGCTFYGNSAINGGALSWSGNNGIIDDCLFIDNIARGVGGAIYIGGTNNTIINSIFINSSSQLSNEAIYLDYKRENINLKNNAYKDSILYIDGARTNIDVNYLHYSYTSPVADENIDIVPLVYCVLTNGVLSYFNNGMLYYGEYNNKDNEFTLHITKYFGDISFTKNYKFKKLADCNTIFYDMINYGDYENTLTMVKSIDIFSNIRLVSDYETAISTTTKCFNSVLAYLFHYDETCLINTNTVLANAVRCEYPISFGLNINFCDALTISSSHAFNLNAVGFDIVNINGHGTKIYTKSSDSDENKWAILGENKILSISDLIIEGFNTGIENFAGECILNSVTFNHNRMDYWIYRDYGAAIISTGIVDCKDCTFTNNYAKYGGAIFSQGIINLEHCHFSGNEAYGKGDDVCIGEGGIAIVNNVVTTYDTIIVTHCDKTAKQNFIAKFIDNIKGNDIEKIIDNLFSLGNDVDVSAFYPNEVHTEGLKVMSRIYHGGIQ